MIEVYITNGDPQNSTAVKDSITHNLTLTAGELTDLLLATNALQTIDITNCGWIIDNTENEIERIIIKRKAAPVFFRPTISSIPFGQV